MTSMVPTCAPFVRPVRVFINKRGCPCHIQFYFGTGNAKELNRDMSQLPVIVGFGGLLDSPRGPREPYVRLNTAYGSSLCKPDQKPIYLP